MDNKKYFRVMFHCVNGTGLGHITRAINISKIILKNKIASEILIESDGKYTPKNLPRKVNFLTLKYTNHQMYKNPKLRIKQEQIVKKIITDFKPDIFVVDNETPIFIKNNKLPNVRKIFVLRSVEEEFLSNNLNLLKRSYDKIIIPHTKKEFNFLYSRKTIKKLEQDKFIFVGPIIRQEKTKNVKKKYDFIATIGGGGLHHNPKKPGTFFKTSEENLKIICETFRKLKRENAKLRLGVLCGQNFPVKSFKELKKKFGEEINIIYASESPLNIYKKTKVLISQLGYNTTFEAIKYKIPSIFFMKKSIPESQFLRGKWVEKNNLGIFIPNLSQKNLFKEIRNLDYLKINKIKNNLRRFNLGENSKKILRVFENGKK